MFLHVLTKLKRDGLISFLIAVVKYPFEFKKRRNYKMMLRKEYIADRFSDIYEKNLWSSAESGSGDGSEIASTEHLRAWLINNLPNLGVSSFVDASCGDFNWMRHVVQNLELNYLGLDIVKSVVNKNNKLYATNSTKFESSDICKDKIPSCDLIMVRDCLFHLSFEDIDRFLKNIKNTNYKYLLTTTHIVEQGFRNKDITSGDFRIINIFDHPFNFSKNTVKDFIRDYSIKDTVRKEMILLEKKDVPVKLSN